MMQVATEPYWERHNNMQKKANQLNFTSFFTKVCSRISHARNIINPLNAKLNSICPLLSLFGVHHILHVSRYRVKTPRHFKTGTLTLSQKKKKKKKSTNTHVL